MCKSELSQSLARYDVTKLIVDQYQAQVNLMSLLCIVVFLYKNQRKNYNYANKCHRLGSTTVVTTDRALLFCGWYFWNSLVVRAWLG